MMARPTKFDAPTVTGILAGIRAGVPVRLAAEANGVAETTFYCWQRGEFPRGADKALKAKFSQEITRARAVSAQRLTMLIANAAAQDWRAAAWILERRFPADFGRDADLHRRLDALETQLAGDSQPTQIRRIG